MSSLTISMMEMPLSRAPPGGVSGLANRIFGAPGLRCCRNCQACSATRRELVGAVADQILGRRMREQARDEALHAFAAAAFERIIRLLDQPACRAFFFAAEKSFNIHCRYCPRTKARSFRSSLSQLPATVEGATPPHTRFCWPARPARLPRSGRGGSQVNKTERKPSKNNGKGKKMAVAKKPLAGARRKAVAVRPGTAKAAPPARGKMSPAPAAACSGSSRAPPPPTMSS